MIPFLQLVVEDGGRISYPMVVVVPSEIVLGVAAQAFRNRPRVSGEGFAMERHAGRSDGSWFLEEDLLERFTG